MTEQHHTPEPWLLSDCDVPPRIYCNHEGRGDEPMIAILDDGTSASLGVSEAEANARRIVACVNACAGVPTEWLEAQHDPDADELFGPVPPLHLRLQGAMQAERNALDEVERLRSQRNELVAELEHLREIAMTWHSPQAFERAMDRLRACQRQRDELLAVLAKIRDEIWGDDPMDHYNLVCAAIAKVQP